jgi:hypothetical protein
LSKRKNGFQALPGIVVTTGQALVLEVIVAGSYTKSGLSAQQRRLLETMQRLNFGRIEELAIRNGQPVFQPAPRIVQDIKIGGENGPRPELTIEDFALKSGVIELFDHLSRIGDGTLESLEVKNGMPFKLVVEQAL